MSSELAGNVVRIAMEVFPAPRETLILGGHRDVGVLQEHQHEILCWNGFQEQEIHGRCSLQLRAGREVHGVQGNRDEPFQNCLCRQKGSQAYNRGPLPRRCHHRQRNLQHITLIMTRYIPVGTRRCVGHDHTFGPNNGFNDIEKTTYKRLEGIYSAERFVFADILEFRL